MLPLRERLAAYPRPFWVLFVGTLVNRLGLVVLPFLTFYLTEDRRLSPAAASGIVALYGAGALASSLAGGALADRLGRRPTILVSLFGGAAVVAAIPFVPGVGLLAAAVAVLGFLGEMYRPAVSAAVSDLVPEVRRARAFALLYWVINVGAAVGPAMAGVLATRSYRLLFFLNAAAMAGYALIAAVGVPETRPAEAPAATAVAVRPARFREALSDPLLAGLALCTLLVTSLFFQAFTTLPLAMRADRLSEADYGLAVGANGALIVALSLFVARRVERRAPLRVLALAAAVVGVGFAAMAPAHTLAGYVAAIALWTLGEIMLSPVAPALVARLAPVRLRGAYQGVYGAAWGLGFLTGPAVGGLVLDRFGAGALWLGSGAVGLVAAAGYLTLHRLGQRRLAG